MSRSHFTSTASQAHGPGQRMQDLSQSSWKLMAYRKSHYVADARSARLATAAAVVALHAAIAAVLWQMEPVRSAFTASAPIMVSLVSPPHAKPDVLPKPLPPKPRVTRPVPPQVPQKPPVMTAMADAPASYTAPPPPTPAPPVEAAPPAPVAVAPTPASAPSPAPTPVIPPRFNANYLNNPPPAYPPLARRMGEEGKVVLRVFVNDHGLPEDVEIRTSSGSSRLDTTALETVRQWKFVPARRGETPIGAWVLVPISFSLRS
jgi:protein TonB